MGCAAILYAPPMNYLAHVFLAQHSDHAMVGALLGDFAKADISGLYPPEMVLEIELHRRIDTYTDTHPTVREAVQLFGEGRRRFAGIVLDVFYDHLLARRWEAYSDIPLRQFIDRFYAALDRHHAILPERLRKITPYLIGQDWLGTYRSFEGVEWTVRRIAQRLSRNGELLTAGLADVREHYAALEVGFDRFFPELVQFSIARRAELQENANSKAKAASKPLLSK